MLNKLLGLGALSLFVAGFAFAGDNTDHTDHAAKIEDAATEEKATEPSDTSEGQ